MESLRNKLIILFIIFFVIEVSAQNSFTIRSAILKKDKLKVTFSNPTQQSVFVPNLSYRIDMSVNNGYLDNKYFHVVGDTLVIVLSKQHPDGLINSKGEKAINSKVEFDDNYLEPGRYFKTKIKINSKNKRFKFIKIQYDNNISISKLKQK